MFCQNRVEIITKTNERDDVRWGSGTELEILCIMFPVTVCVRTIMFTISTELDKRHATDWFIGLNFTNKVEISEDHEFTLVLEMCDQSIPENSAPGRVYISPVIDIRTTGASMQHVLQTEDEDMFV